MKWLEATEAILREANTPMKYGEIAGQIVRRNLVTTRTKRPAVTLYASISVDTKRREERGLLPRFVIRPGGIVSLAEWEVGPISAVIEEANRSRDHAKRELLRKLRGLDGGDFESFLEVLFTRMGYDVVVIGGSGDDGIDLVAELTGGIAPQRVGVQAKAKGAPRHIGPNTVRLLRDALTTQQCTAGAVVSTASFNDDARRVASEPGKPPVSLIGPDDLTELALEHKVGVVTEPVELYEEALPSVFEPESPKEFIGKNKKPARRKRGKK